MIDGNGRGADNQYVSRPGDESGVIISWFVRVALVLAVIGVVGFDVGSIVINTVTLDSAANDVAVSISVDIAQLPGEPSVVADAQIYALAVEYVKDKSNGVAGARVLKRGTEVDDAGIVHVRLRRRANTVVTKLISPLEKFTIATGDGQAGTN